jgi:hypothetical protein
MSVDTKLAHGLAGNSFREVLTYASGMMNLLQHLHFLPKSPARTPKGARKLVANAKRYISVAATWILEKETNREGPAIHWLFFTPADKNGNIELCSARYAPISTTSIFSLDPILIIKKHALARVHQRMDEMQWGDIKFELTSIGMALLPMIEVTKALSLKQIFLPSLNGIFVGCIDSDGRVVINTFLVRGKLSSRWEKALATFYIFSDTIFANTENHIVTVDALLDNTLHIPSAATDVLIRELANPDFDWLREEYQPGVDNKDEYWAKDIAEPSQI